MHCSYCQKNIKEIDFKDIQSLRMFTSAMGKVRSRKKTGLCANHQRHLAQAIKRARFMALLPYVRE